MKKVANFEKHMDSMLNESIKRTQLNEWSAAMVLKQLGGNKFIAMTGAKQFAQDPKKRKIVFKIGGGAKHGINYIRITLNGSDTYNMEFIKVRGTSPIKVIKKVTGVYNDQLQQIFTQETGFETHL